MNARGSARRGPQVFTHPSIGPYVSWKRVKYTTLVANTSSFKSLACVYTCRRTSLVPRSPLPAAESTNKG